jgi:uncharacterized protein (DUF885 family)
MTTPVGELADRYVERVGILDPLAATFEGITGHDAEMTDYSPDGVEERQTFDRTILHELGRTPITTEGDRIAAEVMRDQLERGLALADDGESFRELNVLACPVQYVRQCFDLMPRATLEDWETITARAALVPQALSGFEATLDEGRRQGLVAAQRQAVACAQQADVWGGVDGRATPFFLTLVDAFDASGIDDPALHARLTQVAERATRAYSALGRYLIEEYLPDAVERDAVGPERYARWAAVFNGIDLDLRATYDWGWDELHRIEHAMGSVADRIVPGEPLDDVVAYLDDAPDRAIEGVDKFRQWLQDLLDTTVEQLNGVHFDIPEPVQRVEAMIAPDGGAAAMYYTGPAEDFSRPGRTWYPTLGKTRFPLWREVSICYHEGVPGHHLQIAQVRYLADSLTRFQRTLAGCSGHAEGWALYAERLMGELGYLDDPASELGMLAAQAMRAARVVVDIGLHLELEIPASERYNPGTVWTPDLALDFMVERSKMPRDFMSSEIDRYLGLPGQAISYKVGEREWLEARDDARRLAGDTFDLKAFHARALDLGPMGLAQLRRELAG